MIGRIKEALHKITGTVRIGCISGLDNEFPLIWKSLFTSGIFIGVTLLIGSYWETNDDPSIAYLLSLSNNDYSPFQWRLLCVILHALFVNVPVINWWAVNCMLALGLAAFSFSYVIYRRFSRFRGDVITFVVLVMLWITAGYCVNFTRSASVVAIGGCLMIADSILSSKNVRIIEYAFGVLLFLYGASIRSNSALIALGFLASIGGTWLLFDGFSFKLRWFRSHMQQILGLCLAAVLFFGVSAFDSLLLTTEQKQYLDYNDVRSQIQDYTGSYPSFETATDAYQNAGVNQVTHQLLFAWFSEDTELITQDTMEAITQLKTDHGTIDLLKDRAKQTMNLINMAFMMCLLLALCGKWNFFRIVPTGLLAIAFSSILSIAGRLPFRVFESIIMLMMISMVFISGSHDGAYSREGTDEQSSRRLYRIITVVFKQVVSFALIVAMFVSLWLSWDFYEIATDMGQHPWDGNEEMAVHRENSLDHFHQDEDYVYLYDLLDNPYSMSYSFNMWEPRPIGYCENVFLLGGWDARHPDFVERLRDFGILNPVRALIENPRVRSVYSPRLMEYLWANYDPRITATEVEFFGNTLIVQYCAPIEDSEIVDSQTNRASIEEFAWCEGVKTSAWYLKADVKTSGDQIRDFYCNLTVNGIRYTYRLRHNDGELIGYFYGIAPEFDWEKANICIFELTADGQYVEYKIQ